MPHCRSCGASANPGDRFCGACGAADPIGPPACPSCGTTVEANARFCSECGAAIGGGGTASSAARPAAGPPMQAAPVDGGGRDIGVFWPRSAGGNIAHLVLLAAAGAGMWFFAVENPIDEPAFEGKEPVLGAAATVVMYVLLVICRGFARLVTGPGGTAAPAGGAAAGGEGGSGVAGKGMTIGGVIAALLVAGLVRKCTMDGIRERRNERAIERIIDSAQPRQWNRTRPADDVPRRTP